MTESTIASLSITLRGLGEDGTEEEIKRELRRSMVPWGILERAIELQDEFENLEEGGSNITKDQFNTLTGFVIYVFDDKVTVEELKRWDSVEDMLNIYMQVIQMVAKSTAFQNPTTPQVELQKVRSGKSRKRK